MWYNILIIVSLIIYEQVTNNYRKKLKITVPTIWLLKYTLCYIIQKSYSSFQFIVLTSVTITIKLDNIELKGRNIILVVQKIKH